MTSANGEEPREDLARTLREQLESSEGSDDEARLSTLDRLYERLERELEGDLDQEDPSGR